MFRLSGIAALMLLLLAGASEATSGYMRAEKMVAELTALRTAAANLAREQPQKLAEAEGRNRLDLLAPYMKGQTLASTKTYIFTVSQGRPLVGRRVFAPGQKSQRWRLYRNMWWHGDPHDDTFHYQYMECSEELEKRADADGLFGSPSFGTPPAADRTASYRFGDDVVWMELP